MRILHLATFLQGGAGRIVTDLAIEQHKAGHDVSVVASATGVPGYGNYQAYLDALDRHAIRTRLVDSMFERQHAANLAVVRTLDGMYPAGSQPDLIHTHAAVPSLVALLFAGARRSPIALVQTMHGWGVVKTPDQVSTDVALLNLVDCVVVPSAHSAGVLASLGVSPSRISLVPYGVRGQSVEPDDRDLETLQIMARQRRRGALVVACVGTFGARKNQSLLARALAHTRDANVFAVFVGDGDDRELRDAVQHACAEGRVLVHGYSRAARPLAAAADLLVLPSRSEGQPIAVLDAFCDGTLVAVSDIPELTELVADGATGFTFASDDAEALGRTLADVARLPNSTRRAIRERARARYLSQFTVSAMTAGYMTIYAALVDTSGPTIRRQTPPAA